VAGLAAGGWAGEEAHAQLHALLAEGGGEAALAVARALAEQPSPAFEDLLLRLADDPSEEILAHVAVAMGALRSPRFLPALLGLLGLREVRTAARAALLAYGPEGLASLDHALGDRALPLELRRQLPRTISLFPPAEAAAVLERHILEEPSGGIRYRILRGMNRLAAAPAVVFDAERLRRATAATVQAVFRVLHWRLLLERGAVQQPARATAGHELLVQLLRDKEGHAIERLFRLLSLQHRGEDFKGMYRGLRAADPRARASSRELLENLLEPPLRDAVLAIVDESPDESRLARAGEFYTPVRLGYEGVLELMLESGGESLRCVVAHHVGEMGLVALRPRLERMRRDGVGFFLSRVVERALLAISGAERGRVARA
jgi:hypothetical protein